jgi:hypothetical protein
MSNVGTPRCQYITSKGKKCDRKDSGNGLCTRHQPKNSIELSTLPAETKQQKYDETCETDTDTISIIDVDEIKKKIKTNCPKINNIKQNMDIEENSVVSYQSNNDNKYYVFDCIDEYFDKHYRRCKTLSMKKESSSFLQMDKILPILLMTAVPLLGKFFISTDNINAPYINQQINKDEGRLTNGSIQGSSQTTPTTTQTNREENQVKATKNAFEKTIKNDGY